MATSGEYIEFVCGQLAGLGAVRRYILDMENRDLVRTVVGIPEPLAPLPGPKKRGCK